MTEKQTDHVDESPVHCFVRTRCVSCDDEIEGCSSDDSLYLQDAMRFRCYACASEKIGELRPRPFSLQHGTGGGRRIIRETKTH